ncbi:hypothetical protein ANPL_02850 [Anaplasma platys]|uniref:Uncharacterized protein n=1 Tax=Anaplasma platys TaxID=949 RepID=A0A858PYF5_9RICK|nr:hypothetical protein ANPL_02850 [Anaplasma platys]
MPDWKTCASSIFLQHKKIESSFYFLESESGDIRGVCKNSINLPLCSRCCHLLPEESQLSNAHTQGAACRKHFQYALQNLERLTL